MYHCTTDFHQQTLRKEKGRNFEGQKFPYVCTNDIMRMWGDI